MKTIRLSRTVTATAAVALILSACVPAQQYNALENDYNQLNQQLSGEIASQQVHITRLQGAIKVAVNSDLLFPSGINVPVGPELRALGSITTSNSR